MLFSIIGNLGLDHLMIREFSKDPELKDVYLGTTTLLKLIGGIIAIGLILCLSLLIKADNKSNLYVIIYSITLFFQGFSMVSVYFESQFKSYYIVLVELGQTFLLVLLKIWVIFYHKSLVWFIVIQSSEWLLISTGLLFIYFRKYKDFFKWKIDIRVAQKLLAQSWPFILSGASILIYQRLDQVMLKFMTSPEKVGYYAVAMRITSISSIFPLYFMRSITPILVKLKQQSEDDYKQKQQLIMDLVIWGGIIFTGIAIIFVPFIVKIAFGESYLPSIPVLRILIINVFFYSIAVTTANTLLIESMQKYDLIRHIAGAVINIILNFMLIPLFQEQGAAWSSVIARAFAAIFINIFIFDLHILFNMQKRSIISGWYRLIIYFCK